jgi:hypothetical protein
VGQELPPFLVGAGLDELGRGIGGLDGAGVGVDTVAEAEDVDGDQAEGTRSDRSASSWR